MPSTVASGRGWPHRVAKHLPVILLEQPWAIFIKSLCIISGLTTFVGPSPGSIESALPQPVVYLWAGTLVCGSGAALFGLLKPTYRKVEIAGLIWLGTAAIVYAVAIITRFDTGGAVAAGIVMGFGLAALIRALAVYVSFEIVRRAVN